MKIQLSISLTKDEVQVLHDACAPYTGNQLDTIKRFCLQDEYKSVTTFDAPFAWTKRYVNVLSKLFAFIKNAVPLFTEYTSVLEESKKYVTIEQ